MFQRVDFPLILLLRRKYLAIGGVGGGVMLMSMVSTLRYTHEYSGRTVTLEVVLPEYATLTRHSTYFKRLNMGARTSLRSSCRACLLLWARPLSSIQRFQGGLRLWLRRPEKVGLNTCRTRSVC